jgi:predicted RNase H-like nuclease (RuvC/YqgF family)
MLDKLSVADIIAILIAAGALIKAFMSDRAEKHRRISDNIDQEAKLSELYKRMEAESALRIDALQDDIKALRSELSTVRLENDDLKREVRSIKADNRHLTARVKELESENVILKRTLEQGHE